MAKTIKAKPWTVMCLIGNGWVKWKMMSAVCVYWKVPVRFLVKCIESSHQVLEQQNTVSFRKLFKAAYALRGSREAKQESGKVETHRHNRWITCYLYRLARTTNSEGEREWRREGTCWLCTNLIHLSVHSLCVFRLSLREKHTDLFSIWRWDP